MPPRVVKEEIGTLLLASEMPVPIPRNRTVDEVRTQPASVVSINHLETATPASDFLLRSRNSLAGAT